MAGIKAALVAAVAIFVSIIILSCSAGFGSRLLLRVSTRPVPIPVGYLESDLCLGLSRSAPLALLVVMAVNRVDQKQFGAANPPRHGCVHFGSPLGVNKQKEPSRAAARGGKYSRVFLSMRRFRRGRMGYPIWKGV
jgi:hypothetical protein